MNSFVHTRTLTLYIHNIHISSIKKKEHTNMPQQLELCTYCSINKQYVEGVQNRKISYLKQKDIEDGFLKHMTSYEAPVGHVDYQREIINYCIYTSK